MHVIRHYMSILEHSDYRYQVSSEPSDGLWFRHESPYWLPTLRPLSYDELHKIRPEYPIADRQTTEAEYRHLTSQNVNMSFLYATIVGCNNMESPVEYPGFTYYFKLSPAQIELCIFDVVDKQIWMQPQLGQSGLSKAQLIWDSHKDEFASYWDDEIGTIDPRVEVIIPFAVIPVCYFPQQEDRA